VLVVVEREGAELELELELDGPDASVADLVAAVDPVAAAVDAGVEVDGRYHGPDEGLDELPLRDGVRLRLTSTPPLPRDLPGYDDELALVAGPRAGRAHRLDGDHLVVGRDPACDVHLDDPTVSLRHVELERDHDRGGFTVRDLGSSNGTWIDGRPVSGTAHLAVGGLLRLGAVHAVVRTPVSGDELRVGRVDGATSPFNRPPRPGTPAPSPDLALPPPPKERRNDRAFSAVALVGPLLMGGVMIAITGNPRFAMFMLMSPVMLLGNHLAGKRRSRKESVTADREFRRALDQLRVDLATRADDERLRRDQLDPDLVEVVRRAEAPSTTLWQRRPDHDDYLRVRVGTGDVPWDPPVEAGREAPPAPVRELLDGASPLARAPVTVDLVGGGVVGIVGDRDAGLALARALLSQLTVHQGPADLSLLVTVAEDREADWDWTKWLPHTRDATGATRTLTADQERSSAMLGAVLAAAEAEAEAGPTFRTTREVPRGPVRCLVVDDVRLLAGRRAPARLLLGGAAGPVTGIVLADREEQLPAVCDTVVECWSDLGDAELRRPQERLVVRELTVAGLDDATARRCARALARFEDPELSVAGAGLPQLVRLLPLLGLDELTPDALLQRWSTGLPDPPLRTPVGRSDDGVVDLDLVVDGPHGLIGGTTGSGKSELLRSLIAGLAATVDPDHLVFVLVDYKGGSAFDECARLPHTVGMVTDLDDHLGERALRSLEAELHHRERVLREAGAQDLPEYRRLGTPLGPVPRLVVVIDEFATLATELPDFLGALVGIAQRGRSLGVHLILATQRPRGAVNANIKANTNLRIALRVQDDTDSIDIIDRADAAKLSRATPGRALVRLGPGDVELVQTPLSTIGSSGGRAEPLRLRPFRFTPAPRAADTGGDDEVPSDLARLVAAANEAFARSGAAPPRQPWLEMLGDDLDLDELLAQPTDDDTEPVRFALADEPDRQRQRVVGWDPAEGHLALSGMVGSGTTTALVAVACALAATYEPSACHLYALDFGAGDLASLADLPHVGAVIGATEREAQYRLIRTLRRELDRRRDLPAEQRAAQPRQVVLIDGIGGFLAEHEGLEGAELSDAFKRLFTEGPTVGISFVTAGDRPGALPLRLASVVSQRWLFRLAEVNDFGSIGLRAKQVPAFVPGRAVRAEDHRVVQVARPSSVAAFAERVRARLGEQAAAPAGAPVRITSLPAELPLDAVPGAAVVDRPLRVPVGVTDEDLGPAVLELHPGEHALVAGPPRSGKSSLLRVLAQQLRAADPGLVLVGVCNERSPLFGEPALDAFGTPERLAGVLAAAPGDQRRWVVLVDDAPAIDDESGAFATIVRCGRADLHLVATGRTDELGSDYGRWTRQVRQSRTGVLLQPNLLTDGNLLGVKLPRRVHVSLGVGRGFLVVGGVAHLAQFALPRDARTDGDPGGDPGGGHDGDRDDRTDATG
jgi:DNA segregation ATPase FtsK/SpoIIIE, S-DNA-T family